MTVNPQRFAATMADCCFEQGISAPHKKAFKLIAKTFNDKISGLSTGLDIIAFPTGSGKTKALEQYASMTSDSMLIAVRRIDDARTIVANINQNSGGRDIARATYYENKLDPSVINETRVIVITHAAYKKMFQSTSSYYASLSFWHGEKRKLHVIDESLDIFECAQKTLSVIESAAALITPIAREKYPSQAERLDQIIEFIETNEGIIHPYNWEIQEEDISPLIQYGLKGIRMDHDLLERNDTEINDDLLNHDLKALLFLNDLPSRVCNIIHEKDAIKIHSAKMALPFNQVNAVILDATANQNIQYKLLRKKEARIIQPPSGIRNYRNVTLYVSREHKLGRVHLSKVAKDVVPQVMREMAVVLRNAKKILICTHSNIETDFLGYDGLPPYGVAHYGAIDGRNDWNQNDAMLILGIPYIPPHTLETQVAVLEERCKKRLKRKRAKLLLSSSVVVTSIIQTMNRIRCRNVIDAKGNCKSASIYLFLPNKSMADKIMEAIEKEMPDIKIVEMKSELASRKAKRSQYDEILIAFLSSVALGSTYTRKEINKKLKIGKSNFDRLICRAKDKSSFLYAALTKIGVTLRLSSSGGRGKHLIFEKQIQI